MAGKKTGILMFVILFIVGGFTAKFWMPKVQALLAKVGIKSDEDSVI